MSSQAVKNSHLAGSPSARPSGEGLNIAVFMPTFAPTIGGAEIAAHNILKGLSRYEGVNIHLFLPYRTKKKLDNQAISLDYEVHSLPPKFVSLSLKSGLMASIYFHLYFWLFFRSLKVDVVWFNFIYPLPTGIKNYFLRKRIPYVATGRGVDIQKQEDVNYGYRLNSKCEREIIEILKGATVATCLTEAVLSDYRELGVPERKLVVVPNAIDKERFDSIEATDLHKEYGIKKGLKVILTVGRYTPKKGFEFIPGIIREVTRRRDDFVWILVGKGIRENLTPTLDKEVARFLKFVPEIGIETSSGYQVPDSALISIYKSSDLFVFPTTIEIMGNVIIEAMACGVPVITSNVPGCRELIRSGDNGILVERGNLTGFALRIDELLQNDEMRRKIISSADRCVEKYSYISIIRRYYDLFSSVASGSFPPEDR